MAMLQDAYGQPIEAQFGTDEDAMELLEDGGFPAADNTMADIQGRSTVRVYCSGAMPDHGGNAT